MVYLKSGNRIGTVARIKKIMNCSNSLLEATISYRVSESKENTIRFTGKMLDKAKKMLHENDVIAVLLEYSLVEHVIYVVDFCKEGSYFLAPTKEMVLFAKPMKGEGTARFYTKGMPYPFHEVQLDKTIDPTKTALCVASGGKERITSKGKTLIFYDSCNAYCSFEIQKQPVASKNTLITIGCYENHPTKASDLLKVPFAERSKVLEWMAFAADSWDPPAIGNLREQKAAIALVLKEERKKNL